MPQAAPLQIPLTAYAMLPVVAIPQVPAAPLPGPALGAGTGRADKHCQSSPSSSDYSSSSELDSSEEADSVVADEAFSSFRQRLQLV